METTYTDDQLKVLKDALASGVLRVRFADRDIEYRSVDDLKIAIATVEQEMARVTGTEVTRQIRVFTGKGA